MSHAVHIPRALRPRQWFKNVLLLAGLYFPESESNAPLLFHASAVERALVGFIVFCALSSAVYILNDIIDAPRDRLHPKKKQRPIASGALHPGTAGMVGVVL
ncbi:UbiA family prenyltransferase, partial [Candidatus Sumerlaeota bacterium]|nr:UbiA family prenyltransferase [Candidatus Sumerlaeota bacterium]